MSGSPVSGSPVSTMSASAWQSGNRRQLRLEHPQRQRCSGTQRRMPPGWCEFFGERHTASVNGQRGSRERKGYSVVSTLSLSARLRQNIRTAPMPAIAAAIFAQVAFMGHVPPVSALERRPSCTSTYQRDQCIRFRTDCYGTGGCCEVRRRSRSPQRDRCRLSDRSPPRPTGVASGGPLSDWAWRRRRGVDLSPHGLAALGGGHTPAGREVIDDAKSVTSDALTRGFAYHGKIGGGIGNFDPDRTQVGHVPPRHDATRSGLNGVAHELTRHQDRRRAGFVVGAHDECFDGTTTSA